MDVALNKGDDIFKANTLNKTLVYKKYVDKEQII